MSSAGSIAMFVVFGLLVAWRLYSRARRLIGRQRSRKWRHVLSVILIPLLLATLAMGAWFSSEQALLGIGAGIVIGVGLALWGIRLTRFERTDEGWFYTPNARIGIALMVAFVGRIGYRAFELARQYGGPLRGAATQDMMRSPLTLLILATLLSYYAAYSAGLLRWRLARG